MVPPRRRPRSLPRGTKAKSGPNPSVEHHHVRLRSVQTSTTQAPEARGKCTHAPPDTSTVEKSTRAHQNQRKSEWTKNRRIARRPDFTLSISAVCLTLVCCRWKCVRRDICIDWCGHWLHLILKAMLCSRCLILHQQRS